MDYGDSVQKVLLRKIRKAEQDLLQLKLDYCRFVFGLTHRARVVSDGTVYLVRSVDVESMKNTEEGGFTRPAIAGMPINQADTGESIQLGTNWELDTVSDQAAIK
ncbi:hypothetical protein [Marinobacter sp. F4218]|uniref:hypothetical protein n=1 Tax=Marinobacter sp. F4218 TaxID=2862868 RepID=UPI001C626FB5|nr:hypothetical protein [Marinobacter sp. F4218]MBW7469885.1 hypothetical protein [Marinobacter sp. F4218]